MGVVLWQSLPDTAPVSAALADGAEADLNYRDRHEIRAWPSFDLLGTGPSRPAPPPEPAFRWSAGSTVT